jgi:hypothetical protein
MGRFSEVSGQIFSLATKGFFQPKDNEYFVIFGSISIAGEVMAH